MKVAIYGRNFDIGFKEYIKKFFEILDNNNIEVYIYEKFHHFLINESDIKLKTNVIFSKYSEIKNKVDLLFSIGGDGTILEAVTIVRDSEIPIVGINTGKLGFLASIANNEIEIALDAILSNNYTIEERTLLKMESTSGLFNEFPYCLNEVAIQKVDSTMITVHVYIDGELYSFIRSSIDDD